MLKCFFVWNSGKLVLCSWAVKVSLIVPLPLQKHEWVLAKILGWYVMLLRARGRGGGGANNTNNQQQLKLSVSSADLLLSILSCDNTDKPNI